MTGTDQAVGAPERLHPWYLVSGLGSSLRQMVGAYIAVGYFAATGSWRTAAMMLGAISLFVVVGIFLYWRRFEFRVGANEIRIDSGILNRLHRSIPFDRIQDVDITQGPLARLLGLARVRFETGGSAGAKQDDGSLDAISLARAEAIRDQVRARCGTITVDAEEAAAERAPLFAMDLRRVLLAGVFNFSLAVVAGLAGASQTIGNAAGFDPFTRRFWRDALAAGSPLADFVLAHRVTAALAGMVLLIVVGLVTGVGRTVLRDYRFRLDRTATGFRRRRGLVTLTDVTLPLQRVQAAIIATGPLRAKFGWRDLKLQSLGKDEGSKGDHVVAPLATTHEVAAILAELEWRPVDPTLSWHRVSPAHAWTFTAAMALLIIPAAVQLLLVPLLGVAGLVLIAAVIGARWLGWRRTRYTLDDDRLLVHSGWWRRRLVILPLASIQSVDLTENLISRRFGVASLTIGVASGRGYSAHGIASLTSEIAGALRQRLLAKFA
ncbi:MAG: PH domain-containing protein [Sphingomonas bacterium]|nr:PH domain-containing protein [Sphingomonas bacterium]